MTVLIKVALPIELGQSRSPFATVHPDAGHGRPEAGPGRRPRASGLEQVRAPRWERRSP
jgi:hypothetical protein